MLKSHKFVEYHRGPNMSRIPVGGDVAGMIAGVGIVIGAWIGLPDYRWFWIASGLGGGIVGGCLYFWHRRKASADELTMIDLHSPRPPR